MELIEKAKKMAIVRTTQQFPKTHIMLACALLCGLGLVTVLPAILSTTKHTAPQRHVQTIAIPYIKEHPIEMPELPAKEMDAPISMAVPITPAIEPETIEYTEPSITHQHQNQALTLKVKPGDSLSVLFKRAGLNNSALMNFMSSNKKTKQLTSLRPGQTLNFYLDADNNLVKLTLDLNQLSSLAFIRENGSLVFKEIEKIPDIKLAYKEATIQQSLYMAGSNAQLDDALIMNLAGIFGWDIDFALDMRKGDHFKILFEENFLDGEKISNGDILAAEFTNQGNTFKAVRYTDKNNRSQYFTPTGESMQKAFLRAPLDFRRISSNFNPRRLHPIFKTVKPHRGTDYAAPRGTPVWAAGDGKVIASSYSKANGHYIFIQHGNNIQTKYLHLHKRLVSRGDRVRQKQKVGTVGSTGYSNAPHLHYEFLLGGVHRNPRTILKKLPKVASITQDQLIHFINQTQPLMAVLEQEAASTKYASSDSLSTKKSM